MMLVQNEAVQSSSLSSLSGEILYLGMKDK